eukprot:TRINITY_DN18527_c0_g1_i2.p1 TRINITY_DN18527_c0_g1~~TRINITY_DN18527_c0_g1_i2.p1  ORF type:complete len:975 (-),score=255.07 TRINITY_DN18527_c0_g1_i2:309-2807(-)
MEGETAEEAEEEPWNWQSRVEAARSAWQPAKQTAVAANSSDWDSLCFDARAASSDREKVASAITLPVLVEAFDVKHNAVRVASNLVKLALSGNDPQKQLASMLRVLLATHGSVDHNCLSEAVAKAFGRKWATLRALSEEELPEASLEARRLQSQLFGRARGVLMSELDEALSAMATCRQLGKLDAETKRAIERLAKLLSSSSAAGSETLHLVRLLQGHRLACSQDVLCGFSHAMAFHHAPAGKKKKAAPSMEALAKMEDAVTRALAQTAGDVNELVRASLSSKTPEALLAACAVKAGVAVLPMQVSSSKEPSAALSSLGEGAVLAEWLYNGDRIQIHVARRDGESFVTVCGKDGKYSEDKTRQLGDLLLAGLHKHVSDCILDAILLRGKSVASTAGGADAPENGSKATRPTAVVVMDLLLLNGNSLCERPLRERRDKLKGCLLASGPVRLAVGSELAGEQKSADTVTQKLNEAVGASYLAADTERVWCKTLGLVLKKLDGPDSAYAAGRLSAAWQAVKKPAVRGAEADRLLLERLSDEAKKVFPSKDEFYFCVVSGRRTRTAEGIRDILLTQKHYTDVGVSPRWYVDAESLEEYRKLGLDAYPGGKLIPSRNMALEDAFKANKVCVQTSDDIGKFEFFTGGPKKLPSDAEANAAWKHADQYLVSPVAAAQFLLANMRAAKEKTIKLGGVFPLGNGGRAFRSDEFGYSQFILGDFFVAEVCDLRFDTRLDLKEDYDLTAAHLTKYGAVLRCNRLLVHAKHQTNAGGACSYRSPEREQRNIDILREKWGAAIKNHPTRANEIVLRWDWRNSGTSKTSKRARAAAAAEEEEEEEE